MTDGLLLHSLKEFKDLILACFDVLNPQHVVEVGAETGDFTAHLIEWLHPRGGRLTSIDPHPDRRLIEFAVLWGGMHTLIPERSPAALRGLDPADIYLLDGDHNYWSVMNELQEIHSSRSGGRPLVILHDTGWPSARRDSYYSPGSLPSDAVHPHTYERGVVPWCEETILGGFRSGGNFAIALHEGGERNGVLTAVEDFMTATPGYELIVVPAIFGLGFLIPGDHPQGKDLHYILDPYDRNQLLARLEANRLNNYLEVIRLQDEAARSSSNTAEAVEGSSGNPLPGPIRQSPDGAPASSLSPPRDTSSIRE